MSRTANGFSLVETVMVTLVVAIIGQVGLLIMVAATQTYAREETTVTLQADIESSRALILEELMLAGWEFPDRSDIAVSGALPSVDTAGSLDRVSILSDIDYDHSPERITYDATGGRLVRRLEDRVGGAWIETDASVVVEDVQAFDLVFRDADGAVVADASVEAGGTKVVRSVDVSLGVACRTAGLAIVKSVVGTAEIRN